jgi:hypothetical protein
MQFHYFCFGSIYLVYLHACYACKLKMQSFCYPSYYSRLPNTKLLIPCLTTTQFMHANNTDLSLLQQATNW